uniref:EamA domain-containing protein n=1 Tax=Coccolithus braarudii TaxID=221442 RepID=A0A7S0L8Z1_9EUKA|mmetsp:Transcript_21900/g.47147  ORF Transcript_21900/g.47147 Transcript_21900/m.47147 type:complete len:389 (+) Transcript_21900:24-1190(+)
MPSSDVSSTSRASRLRPAERGKGLLVALLSVVLITPDPMFVRWARATGATNWQIVFWKQLGTGAINIVAGFCLLGGVQETLAGAIAAPWHLCFASLMQMGNQLGFNFAFLTTSPARALLFISLNPLWAGLLGRVCLGEVLPKRTVVALFIGAVSSLIVFVPALLPESSKSETEGTLIGDMISIATGMGVAAYITFLRHTLDCRPEASIDMSAGVGNMLSSLAMVPAILSNQTSGFYTNLNSTFVAITIVDALLTGSFYVGFIVAPRYLVGAQLALVMLLETLIAPLWVYIKFGDIPSVWTVAGGTLLLVTLAIHEVVSLYQKRIEELDGLDDMPSVSVRSGHAYSEGAELSFEAEQGSEYHRYAAPPNGRGYGYSAAAGLEPQRKASF